MPHSPYSSVAIIAPSVITNFYRHSKSFHVFIETNRTSHTHIYEDCTRMLNRSEDIVLTTYVYHVLCILANVLQAYNR